MYRHSLSRAVWRVVAISFLLPAVAEAGVEIELMNPVVHGCDGVNEATPSRLHSAFFNRLLPNVGPLDDTDYTDYSPWFLHGGNESSGFRESEFQLDDFTTYEVLNFDPNASGFAQVHLVPFGDSVEDPGEVIYFDVLQSVLQATGNHASLVTPRWTQAPEGHGRTSRSRARSGWACRWSNRAV